MNTDEPDEQLLARLGQNDEDALTILFRRHVPTVYAYARSVVRNGHDAQEVVQQTFLTLWEKRMTLDAYTGSARPWLVVTANYHARNLIRARGRAERRHTPLAAAESDVLHDGPELLAEQAESRRQLDAALASLPALDRQIVELCIREDMPYKQAAVMLGVAHGSVRNRLSRARRTLRTLLTQSGGATDE